MKRILNLWPILILLVIVLSGIYIWNLSDLDKPNKITFVILLGTALIYCLQFINMRQTSENQEQILAQQRNIAQKQHDFNIFTLRMNLRNELVKAFTVSLSSEDLSITNDVNLHLVNIGKICNDIKFAFPRNPELDKTIKLFKKSCEEITKIAPELQYIIECDLDTDDRIIWLRYKNCLEVYVRGQTIDKRVISKQKLQDLHISQKEQDIIFGIMQKYILVSKTKEGIENHIHNLFHEKMDLGQTLLNKICEILDKSIKL